MGNPFKSAKDQSKQAADAIRFMKGTVVDVPGSDALPHGVVVEPRGKQHPIPVPVLTAQYGDANLPSEGTPVLLAAVEGGMWVVLGCYYTTDEGSEEPPSNDSDERVIGHNESATEIRIGSNGDVTIDATGDVILNTDSTVKLADDSGSTSPVARRGDAVEVDGVSGTITEGSSNVESA